MRNLCCKQTGNYETFLRFRRWSLPSEVSPSIQALRRCQTVSSSRINASDPSSVRPWCLNYFKHQHEIKKDVNDVSIIHRLRTIENSPESHREHIKRNFFKSHKFQLIKLFLVAARFYLCWWHLVDFDRKIFLARTLNLLTMSSFKLSSDSLRDTKSLEIIFCPLNCSLCNFNTTTKFSPFTNANRFLNANTKAFVHGKKFPAEWNNANSTIQLEIE